MLCKKHGSGVQFDLTLKRALCTVFAMCDIIDVRKLRGTLGWTQQQLADHCDVDRATVSKWEREPPSKGPALILLRGLRDRRPDDASHPSSDPAAATSFASASAPPSLRGP
ncbi:XRE family transcriptional regulator [Georhizobium profundi]|uniref:XRE family transcriptional regulator n=1 Tax=Georhizobium profundi TaxID=2341112 RepID=A0A3Q8XQ74_9HYPH|nr:XRE family transcriptional regulator [Georhizobium profundi]